MKSKYIYGILLVLFISAFIFSGERTNPPIERHVAWSNPHVKEIFTKACADCHSNETKWPWYSKVAPVSWFVIHHVNEGREEFNLSMTKVGEFDPAPKMIKNGKMPLESYLFIHSDAKLTKLEKQQLIDELIRLNLEMNSNEVPADSSQVTIDVKE